MLLQKWVKNCGVSVFLILYQLDIPMAMRMFYLGQLNEGKQIKEILVFHRMYTHYSLSLRFVFLSTTNSPHLIYPNIEKSSYS